MTNTATNTVIGDTNVVSPLENLINDSVNGSVNQDVPKVEDEPKEEKKVITLEEATKIYRFDLAAKRVQRLAALTEKQKSDIKTTQSDVQIIKNKVMGPNQLVKAMLDSKDELAMLNLVCKNDAHIKAVLNVKTFCNFVAPKWYQAKWEKHPTYAMQVAKAYKLVLEVFTDDAKNRLFLEYLGKKTK